MLAEYRGQKIPTSGLRAAVEALRELFNLRYPLAYAHPYLVAERGELAVQGGAVEDMEDEHVLVLRTGQMLLTGRGRLTLDAATLETDKRGEFIAELTPDRRFPEIVVNPQRRGGLPTVRGHSVLAATVACMVAAGDPIDDVAADYRMTVSQLKQAIEYCNTYRIAA